MPWPRWVRCSTSAWPRLLTARSRPVTVLRVRKPLRLPAGSICCWRVRTMTATFGDFLRPAGEHIAAAVLIRDELPAEATFGVLRQFGRLLSVLVHYLDDWPVP